MNWVPILFLLLSITLSLLYTATTTISVGTNDFVPHHLADPPPLEGVLAENDKLSSVVQLAKGQIDGPESVVFDSKGTTLYASGADGYIYSMSYHDGDEKENYKAEKYVFVGGRPLGIKVDKYDNLIVAEPVKGLLLVGNGTKEISILSNIDDEGNAISTANDVEITSSGDKIYFTDSCPMAPFKIGKKWITLVPSVTTILSGDPQGRLLEYDVEKRTTRVLYTKFLYANGLALSQDESFILMAETGKVRIWKYFLKGKQTGTVELFADNLPGYPDGLSTAADGNFYVALYGKRSKLLDFIAPYPFLKKIGAVLARLMPILPPPMGFIAKMDQNGNIIETLYDLTGKYASTISDVEDHNGKLFIGSLTNNC